MSIKPSQMIGAILIVVLQLGCATTYQPQTSSTARIRVKGNRVGVFDWNQLELMAIDNMPTVLPLYVGQFCKVDSGRHSFVVRYQGNRRFGGPYLEAPPILLVANLKPLQEYEIVGKYSEIEVTLYVREIQTEKPVGPAVTAPLHYQAYQSGGYTPIFVPVPR